MLITALRKERENLYQQGKELGLQEGKTLGLQEGKTLGLQEGMTLGLQEGAQKNARDIAKTMLAEGFEPNLVAKITQLSLQDIAQLQQN